MKLVPIDVIPKRGYHKLQDYIEDFIHSEMTQVEIVFSPDEYKNPHSCYTSWYAAAKRSKRRIKVLVSNGRVFMVKE